jgi:hypothetical protein
MQTDRATAKVASSLVAKKVKKRPTEQTSWQLPKRLLLSSEDYKPIDEANNETTSLDIKRQSN